MDEATEQRIRAAARRELKRRDWTMTELGKRIGRSPQQVSDFLAGRAGKIPGITVDMLDALGLELTVRRKRKT